MTLSCASCAFLRSRLKSQSWNSFNAFPIVRFHDSTRLRQDSATGHQNWHKTVVKPKFCIQPSYGICWSHEIETLPPKDSSGFRYTIILSPDTELRATQSDPQEWPFPKRKAVVRGNPIFGSVEPCELLETRSSSHDASGSKSAFV